MKLTLWSACIALSSLLLAGACSGKAAGQPASAETEAARQYAQQLHTAFKPGLDEAFSADVTLKNTEVKTGQKTVVELTWELGVPRPTGANVEKFVTKVVESLGGVVTFSVGRSRASRNGFSGATGDNPTGGAIVDFDAIEIDGFSATGTIEQPRGTGTTLMLSAEVSTNS